MGPVFGLVLGPVLVPQQAPKWHPNWLKIGPTMIQTSVFLGSLFWRSWSSSGDSRAFRASKGSFGRAFDSKTNETHVVFKAFGKTPFRCFGALDGSPGPI